MTNSRILGAVLIVLCALFSHLNAAALPREFTGQALDGDRQIKIGDNTKKGLVVVFLSAVCPCSHSHLVELKKLTHDFPNFEFVGIHSNKDEPKEIALKYFHEANLAFPIIRDFEAHLADQFKAYKTPHAFVVLNDSLIAYQGGVSSSQHFDQNTRHKYLRAALDDLSSGRKVKTSQARTLGCTISRKAHHVW